MRTLTVLAFMSCINLVVNAQEMSKMDPSPMDMTTFRPDGQASQPVARVIYSRPQAKDRAIFGELVAYDKMWRMGANESTELNVYRDITIDGKKLPVGDYTMYAIPGEKEWTLVISSQLYTWGAYSYDESKDVMRVKVPSKQVKGMQESFGMAFGGADGKGMLKMAWEHTEVTLSFEY